ncbi:organic cation transporter protein-like [Aricia agestis]|uniref:organic cation transporter protein-like n=1 Tax=Aricia agestis TaxID=91739 RepID=UPI001C20C3AE|nr:organic cation transporter protein-like [Aricia agestis]
MCRAHIKEKDEYNDISQILERPGRYQAWQYFLACVPAIFVSMISVNFVFVAGDVNYRCRVPECDSKEPVLSPTWWPNPDIDRCYRPLIKHTSLSSICTNDSFVNTTEKCSDWVYENNDTIVAELNLACEPWKVSFVGTAHGIGMIISMLASGWMCDRFGRKPTLIVCTLGCLIGNFKVLATSYNVYIVLEFLEGAITTGAYTAATVIMSENSSKKTRIVAGVLFAYAIYMGEAVLACIAMFVSNWKNILYIICSPPILFTFNIFFLNESPRWQILNGRIKEAKESLKRMVKMNNLGIEPQVIDRISEENLKNVFGLNNNVTSEGFREVIRSKEIMKRLVAGVVWRLAVSFIYYSMLVNSVFLPGDKYTTFLMTALASFPGELISIYLMNKIGRRKPLQCGFLLCGINCIAIAFVPPSFRWIKITLFLIGKLIVSAIYTGSVVYTVELFPTSVRGSCIGICTLASCGGTMLAPLTPALDLVSPVLGAFIYAFLAITASALFFITPETRDSTLYDTIEQITISSHTRKQQKKHENNSQS